MVNAAPLTIERLYARDVVLYVKCRSGHGEPCVFASQYEQRFVVTKDVAGVTARNELLM